MDDLELASPRPLEPDEHAALTATLRSHLRLTNVSCVFQAEEDATDLLNYALDMVGDGETVGHVLEEMEMMELEICDDEVLDNIRISLGDFVMGLLEPKKKNWREEMAGQQEEVPDSLEHQLLASDNHVSVDLSAKTFADKSRREMEMLFGGGRSGKLKDRMSMYNESGEIVKHGAPEADDEDVDDDIGIVPGKSIDDLRRAELMEVMNDRSLTKDERAKKMDQVRAKYGIAEMKQSAKRASKAAMQNSADQSGNGEGSESHHGSLRDRYNPSSAGDRSNKPDAPTNGVDLSAKAAAAKHAKEMANLFGGGNEKRQSLKDRMAMYNDKGEITKKKKDDEEDRDHLPKEKSQDQLRRDELMVVMKDKTLSKDEKAKRMAEIREKYGGEASKPAEPGPAPADQADDERRPSHFSRYAPNEVSNHNGSDDEEEQAPLRGGVDLSAKTAAEKNKREMESLFGKGKVSSMSSVRGNYQKQLLLDKPGRRSGEPDDTSRGYVQHSSKNNGVGASSSVSRSSTSSSASSKPTNGTSATLNHDQQRRAELQLVMRDKSLNKEEKKAKMDEVRQKYAALAKGQGQ